MEELAHGREVAHEGESGKEGEQDPQGVLGGLGTQLAPRPRRLVQLHLLGTPPLDPALHPQEHLRPNGLGTGVAAPQASRQGSEEEQRQGRDDEQQRQVEEVLGPEGQPEYVELARGQIEQHGLTAFPAQPGQPVVDAEQREHAQYPQVLEQAVDLTGIDLAALGVERLLELIGLRLAGGVFHQGHSLSSSSASMLGRDTRF